MLTTQNSASLSTASHPDSLQHAGLLSFQSLSGLEETKWLHLMLRPPYNNCSSGQLGTRCHSLISSDHSLRMCPWFRLRFRCRIHWSGLLRPD